MDWAHPARAFLRLSNASFCIKLDSGEGKVVKLEWVNPHTWIHLEIE